MDEQKHNETQIEKIEEELREVIPQLENRFRITIWNRLVVLVKWLIFAALTGLSLGLVGTAFGKASPWRRPFGRPIPRYCLLFPLQAF